jgi:hypothetical protein
MGTRLLAVCVARRLARHVPREAAQEVELYIFDLYDNDLDSDDFIYIGRDEPDLVLRRDKIAALRAWIAKKKVTEPFTRDSPEL